MNLVSEEWNNCFNLTKYILDLEPVTFSAFDRLLLTSDRKFLSRVVSLIENTFNHKLVILYRVSKSALGQVYSSWQRDKMATFEV